MSRDRAQTGPARTESRLTGSNRRSLSDAWPEYPQHTNSAFFLAFLGYVAFWYLQGGFRFPALGAIRLEFIVGAVLVLSSASSMLAAKLPQPYAPSGIFRWIVALFIVVLVMIALSRAPQVSWTLFVDRVLKFAMMALFIAAFVTSPGRLRWFLTIYLLSFFKMMQEGISGFITGSLVWENQGTPRLHGATPNYAHPNSFSGTQLGTLPFLVKLLPSAPPWLRPAMIGQAVGAMLIVITTGSRTGYVALLLWLGYVIYGAKQKLRIVAIIAVTLIAAAPFVPPDYWARFETIFTQEDKEGASIDMRKQIFEDALSICLSHPFGVGIGAFTIVRSQVFGRSQATHNLYLEVMADMGIQGLVVFLGFLASMLATAAKISRSADEQLTRLSCFDEIGAAQPDTSNARINEHRKDLALIKATAEAVLMFLVIRVGVGLFGHDFYEIYWWFAGGLLIALTRMMVTTIGRTDYLLHQGSTFTDNNDRSKHEE
jgi:putative inorganic carbon (hco3(-)) transporter